MSSIWPTLGKFQYEKKGYDDFQAEFLQNENIHRLGCIWICFLKKHKGFLQHMKGIRCLDVVSHPAFLEHTFFLFDFSLSLGPLGVEMIHFEPRARILVIIRTKAMFCFI